MCVMMLSRVRLLKTIFKNVFSIQNVAEDATEETRRVHS